MPRVHRLRAEASGWLQPVPQSRSHHSRLPIGGQHLEKQRGAVPECPEFLTHRGHHPAVDPSSVPNRSAPLRTQERCCWTALRLGGLLHPQRQLNRGRRVGSSWQMDKESTWGTKGLAGVGADQARKGTKGHKVPVRGTARSPASGRARWGEGHQLGPLLPPRQARSRSDYHPWAEVGAWPPSSRLSRPPPSPPSFPASQLPGSLPFLLVVWLQSFGSLFSGGCSGS